MLKKASKEDIVISFTNFYDHFFVPSAESNTKITAARLPYFDGDYWSGAAEDMMRNMDKDGKGGSPGKVKKVVTKRSLKAMGYSDLSAEAAKDVIVMQKVLFWLQLLGLGVIIGFHLFVYVCIHTRVCVCAP